MYYFVPRIYPRGSLVIALVCWSVHTWSERKKRKKENVFALTRIYKLVELPVGVNECDHSRKLLNKNHMGKVPSKAAKC